MRVLLACGIATVACLCSADTVWGGGPPEHLGERAEALALRLPSGCIIANQGQWADEGILFAFRARGLHAALRESSFTMHLAREAGTPRVTSGGEHGTVSVDFPGSNEVIPVGAGLQLARHNFFVGGDGRGAAAAVPSYSTIVYENIYDGIDLILGGGDGGTLKYEFRVAPGADYTQIRVRYDGIESLCIDHLGQMHVATLRGNLLDSAPRAWQEAAGRRVEFPARFRLVDQRTFAFALEGDVDPASTLIIDPEIEWMTYLGGSDRDWGRALALDAEGFAIIAGETASTDFEGATNAPEGFSDAFVARLDPEGALVWMTYLGGSRGDAGFAVAVDDSGDALIAGSTNSVDFAGRTNEYHGDGDAFLARVNREGAVEWMTYVGGTSTDWGYGLIAAPGGGAWVAGASNSADLPRRLNENHGVTDAFVARVDSRGAIEWTTCLGGSEHDGAFAITSDLHGRLRVAGRTRSTDFVGRNNQYFGGDGDAFAAGLDAAGSLEWMTYLGGRSNEEAHALTTDAAGRVLVTGWTTSNDFFGRNNSPLGRAFLVSADDSGSLEWMTYVSQYSRFGSGVVADEEGAAFVAGEMDWYRELDVMLAKVGRDGVVQWTENIGGADDEVGTAIARVADGDVLITGWTASADFDRKVNSPRGAIDALLVRVDVRDRPVLRVWSNCDRGGTDITISWWGATPDGQVALIYSDSRGTYRIPPPRPCAGTRLDLGPETIRVVWTGRAGSDGHRTLQGRVPPGACWRLLQLLDLSTCLTSNATEIARH